MEKMKLFSAVFLLSLSVNVFAQTPAVELVRIGAAGAVAGNVQALVPALGAVGRVLESGKPVYLNDKVTTDEKGRLQVMLLDETIFTIGPNSSMVLDEFVYDPATSAGKVTASVTKGVFRFVTGKVAQAKPSSMNVKLPAGTIGIRGTIVAGRVEDDGSSTVVLLGPGINNNTGERPGQISVSNEGVSVSILRPGYGTTVEKGKPPMQPIHIPESKLEKMTLELSAGPHKESKLAKSEEPVKAPTRESGQDTAKAKGKLEGVQVISEKNESLNSQKGNFSQDTINAGSITRWEQMAKLNGTASYGNSGVFNVTKLQGNNPCASNCAGTWNYNLTVNFDQRDIDIQSAISAPHGVNDSHSSTVSFGSKGDAKFVSSSSKADYSFTFLNKEGTASHVEGTASYRDGSIRGVGETVTAAKGTQFTPP